MPDSQNSPSHVISATSCEQSAVPSFFASRSADHPFPDGLVPLSLEPRLGDRDVDPARLTALLQHPDDRLGHLLPPFAAALRRGPTVRLAADALGFRHLYVRRDHAVTAVSTSARALAAQQPAGLDRDAVAAQALIGWQIGDRTPFVGVTTLPAGSLADIGPDGLTLTAPPSHDGERPPAQSPAESVRQAAALLRGYLAAYLDQHPDAVLQLTGGQDSRILLGAIPRARRPGLRTMTLAVPGSPDLELACRLAARDRMQHQVIHLDGLSDLTPAEAHQLVLDAAAAVECSADPLAFACVAWAERQAEAGPRLSGLGGEVARGFYYFGRVDGRPVSAARVRRLANWRIFANEAVAAELLDPDFLALSRDRTLRSLMDCFPPGTAWHAATDAFYLHQRMRRWAGTLASATCLDRTVVNPMLDPRFLALVTALPPASKQGSLFLSRLSGELDPDLSAIPMDGRPAPRVYATRSAANRSRLLALTGWRLARKVTGKVRRRVGADHRAPAGGEVLATLLAEHYRAHPALLEPVAKLQVFDRRWIERLAAGQAALPATAAALLANLEAAAAGASP
jgi:asparagine synthase (glutamine-hydrolysing)